MRPPAFAPALGHSMQHPPGSDQGLRAAWMSSGTLSATGLRQCPSLGLGSPGGAQPSTQGRSCVVLPVTDELRGSRLLKSP